MGINKVDVMEVVEESDGREEIQGEEPFLLDYKPDSNYNMSAFFLESKITPTRYQWAHVRDKYSA